MERRTPLAIVITLAVVAALIAYIVAHRGGTSELGDKRIESLVSGAPRSLKIEASMYTGGKVRTSYTCDGPGRPPEITIEGIPSNARAIAIILYDPDAPRGALAGRGTFVHWLLIEKPGGTRAMAPAEGAVVGVNSAGRTGYYPPCPPRGDKPHRYILVAVALDRWPQLGEGFTLGGLVEQARGHVIAWGMVEGTYSRG